MNPVPSRHLLIQNCHDMVRDQLIQDLEVRFSLSHVSISRSVSSEDISRINLILDIIQAGIVPVGDDRLCL